MNENILLMKALAKVFVVKGCALKIKVIRECYMGRYQDIMEDLSLIRPELEICPQICGDLPGMDLKMYDYYACASDSEKNMRALLDKLETLMLCEKYALVVDAVNETELLSSLETIMTSLKKREKVYNVIDEYKEIEHTYEITEKILAALSA